MGIHGYGASHVVHALSLQSQSRVELVGLVDPLPGPVTRDGLTIGVDELPPIFPTTEALLAATDVDIVIIATPLHTHRAIAELALAAGADVLLEKPPVTTLRDFDDLVAAARATGSRVQVGFQSLGSGALAALHETIQAGDLGELESIAAYGSWTRDRRYWTRAAWAGRRTLNGRPVVDGVLTNPFAHAIMTALTIARWETPDAIASADVDLYRANDIEADDTSSFRLLPSESGKATFGGILSGAFTLAGPREDPPAIVVIGSRGSARLDYIGDTLTLNRNGTTSERRYDREDLLENLIGHRIDGRPLLAPLERTGGFVRFVEAVAAAPVTPIHPSFIRWEGDGLDAHPVIDGVDALVSDTATKQIVFRDTPTAWTSERAH